MIIFNLYIFLFSDEKNRRLLFFLDDVTPDHIKLIDSLFVKKITKLKEKEARLIVGMATGKVCIG